MYIIIEFVSVFDIAENIGLENSIPFYNVVSHNSFVLISIKINLCTSKQRLIFVLL